MVVMHIRPAARAAFGFFILLLVATPNAQQQADPSSKLTTVLADLVRSGSQQTSAVAGSSSTPSSVRDAIQARRLRIDSNNEVQVYILMSAVTDDGGAAHCGRRHDEIRDAARRRVQAHRSSLLTAVAQLRPSTPSACRPTLAREPAGSPVKATRSC